MKPIKVIVAVISVLSVIVLLGCGKKSTDPLNKINLQIVSTSECKQFNPIDVNIEGKSGYIPSNLDCFEFSYAGNKLKITHKNAGFNCCAEISSDIYVSGDTIILTETEQGPPCRCLCLFDIYYEISNLPRGEYIVRFNELYINEQDSILEGVVDLNKYSSGNICIIREHYPWNISNGATGILKQYRGCGGFDSDVQKIFVPDDSNCIVYDYDDSTGILSVRHQNSIFNCCPDSIMADVSVNWTNINIHESESLLTGGCDCVCPFDLDFIISGITPGLYTINLTGRYLEDTVKINLDLINEPSGYYCFGN